jgi:hypothetical protein
MTTIFKRGLLSQPYKDHGMISIPYPETDKTNEETHRTAQHNNLLRDTICPGSYGDAVGNAHGSKPLGLLAGNVRRVGVQQHVRHLHRPLPVLQVRNVVHRLDPILNLHQPAPKSFERIQRLGVRRPALRLVTLAEVHLVGGVLGEDLDERDAQDGLELAGDGADEHHVRLLLPRSQLLVVVAAWLRHRAPAGRRPVREVPGVWVLPKVDSRVQRGCHPDDGRARPSQLLDGVHPGPPVSVLEVAVRLLTHLLPPRLQLHVTLELAVVRVVDVQVLLDPPLDRPPDDEPINGIGVVLDQQSDTIWA